MTFSRTALTKRNRKTAKIVRDYLGTRKRKLDESDISDLIADLLHLNEQLFPSTEGEDSANGIIDNALSHFRAETLNPHAKEG